MSVVLAGAPWVLVAWAVAASGLFRAQRDEIIGLLGSVPWLLLALIFLPQDGGQMPRSRLITISSPT